MSRIPKSRLPAPVWGSNRIHRTLLALTDIPSKPTRSPPRAESPARSYLGDAYGDATGDTSPEPGNDKLLSLREILSAATPTPLERAMARPDSGDFGHVVKVYDQDGGWDEKAVHKGGLSKLRVSHEAAKFLGGGGQAREGQGGGEKPAQKKIPWPVMGEKLGTMAAVTEGTKEIEEMAKQARKENREARVEQIALRVQQLVRSLKE